MASTVPGTPRYAVVAAYVAVLSVVPSALWRCALAGGAELGTTQAWRDFQDLPGTGSVYVVALSLVSLGAAGLTFGLVREWGETVPRWVPGLGGRNVPTPLAATLAVAGAAGVIAFCAMTVANWDHLIGFRGRPAPGWDTLVVAAYLPALLWGPAVLVATYAYVRRRSHRPRR